MRSIGDNASNHEMINDGSTVSAGSKALTITYNPDGSRSFFASADGGTWVEVPVTGTSWSTPATGTITVTLTAGANTIEFYSNSACAPDLVKISVS